MDPKKKVSDLNSVFTEFINEHELLSPIRLKNTRGGDVSSPEKDTEQSVMTPTS